MVIFQGVECASSQFAINAKDCGITKGCWFVPDGCVDQTTGSVEKCLNGATWKTEADGVLFELSTSIDELTRQNAYLGKYISLALSHDQFMVNFLSFLFNHFFNLFLFQKNISKL